MKQLSSNAFQQTQAYVMTKARTVDQARFAFHFVGGSAADVLTALTAYQNDDGGFGYALEPDLRTSASSAIATQQGFNILREVGATDMDPLVQSAVNYLLSTLDQERLRWEIVSSAVEDAPHAPWWTYAKIEENFDGFLANPRAALIGFLYEHKALVPTELLQQLADAQMTHLSEQSAAGKIDMHDLYCYITLANSPHFAEQQRQRLVSTLREAVQPLLATDPGEFAGYHLLPLDVAPAPDALLASVVDRTAIDAHLDYLIDTQLADGSWPLPWSWAFVDETAWAQAERDWKGQIAVNRLRTLATYGRVEK